MANLHAFEAMISDVRALVRRAEGRTLTVGEHALLAELSRQLRALHVLLVFVVASDEAEAVREVLASNYHSEGIH